MDPITKEEILAKLLVGSRGSEGGTAVGALLKDRMLVMDSCSRYSEIGRVSLPICPINALITRLGERAFVPLASTLFGAKRDVEWVA